MTPEAPPPFEGFVAGGPATTLPSQFFVDLLPAIDDIEELRVTLYAFYAIARRRGPLRAVRASELAAEAPLARAFAHRGGAEAIRAALDAALARGSFVACTLADGDALYFMNNDAGRRALRRVRAGALQAPAVAARPSTPAGRPPRPAEVYEQEIGVLSPAVADAIAEAVGRWPEQWLIEAIRLAALRNARSWNYVRAVLERWEAEGRDTDATTGTTAPRTQTGRDHGPYEKVIRRS